MDRMINFIKIIRNHWKKSVTGMAAFSYGISYSIDAYDTEQLMREYCEEAATYGDQPLLKNLKPQHVTVILNPVAKRRTARKLFEKYCEPLLHLAGFSVTIIQTQSENQARNLIANLNTPTDAIIVAGGDGTLSDVITGIMRKNKNNTLTVKHCPVGILPLGQTNRVANSLFYGYDNSVEVRKLADATMAVVKGNTKLTDVVEVELLEKNTDHTSESIYAIGALEWGAWTDAYSRMDRYWYWGSLKRYVTYIINGFKNDINWDCNGIIRYSDPCSGCSKCYDKHETLRSQRRWWHAFVTKVDHFSSDMIPERQIFPVLNEEDESRDWSIISEAHDNFLENYSSKLSSERNINGDNIDFSKVTNENCSIIREIPISVTELQIITQNVNKKNSKSIPSVKIELGPESVNYTDFVTEGWRRLQGNKKLIKKTLEAKNIEIHPLKSNDFADKDRSFYIDNEEFELKPLKVKLLPKSVKMFCSNTYNNNDE